MELFLLLLLMFLFGLAESLTFRFFALRQRLNNRKRNAYGFIFIAYTLVVMAVCLFAGLEISEEINFTLVGAVLLVLSVTGGYVLGCVLQYLLRELERDLH